MNHPYLKKFHSIPVKELLEENRWAESFAERQIEALASFFNAYIAPMDTVIFKEGEVNDFFALICEGSVDITKEAFSGRTKVLQTIGAGKAIGEMSFFDHNPCSANVVTKEEASLLVMDRNHYDLLVNESPRLALDISVKVIQTISSRLRQTSGRLIDLL
ncbi:MAG: Crp/Fnr family transcriptional regulator [Gammaproteobacteria bacterium]